MSISSFSEVGWQLLQDMGQRFDHFKRKSPTLGLKKNSHLIIEMYLPGEGSLPVSFLAQIRDARISPASKL